MEKIEVAPVSTKRRVALVHNLTLTAIVAVLLKLAFEHAPPGLWYGLRTSHLLTIAPTADERWFVSLLAFAVYSLAYTMALALIFSWALFFWQKYWLSIASAWFPLLNLVIVGILFGLPVAAN
jgi:hypothetical protein